MADDRTLGYVYAFLAGWLILVSSNAMAELDGALGATPVNGGPREVYAEFYWGLVLPVVAGSALFGLLFKDAALGDLEWWGTIFFVLYFSVQHTRRESAATYGKVALVVDILGISVFFAVMHEIGLFDQGPALKDSPKLLFGGVLSVPILGGLSRVASGRRPRLALSAAALVAASLGLVASWRGWPSSFGGCMMAILILVVAAYFMGNIFEDGGRRQAGSRWLR